MVSSIILSICVGDWVPRGECATGPEWAVPLWTGMKTNRPSVRLRQHRLSYKSIGVFSTKCCSYYSEETGLNRHPFYLASDLFCWVCPSGVLHILEFYSKIIFQFLSGDKAEWFSSTEQRTCTGNFHDARVEIRYNVSPAFVIAPCPHMSLDFSISKCYKSTRVKLKDHP